MKFGKRKFSWFDKYFLLRYNHTIVKGCFVFFCRKIEFLSKKSENLVG